MPSLKIVKFPNPILRKKAAHVKKVGKAEKEILSDMAETMYLNHGVGLAANQVGIDKQCAVIDVGEGLLKLINPVITRKSGMDAMEEGCLSVPETCISVKRALKISVDFMDEDGRVSRIEAEGLLARAIQHEIDHLSGVLIIDYLNPIKRLFVKKSKKS